MLVTCSACGKRISDRAPACSFCGAPRTPPGDGEVVPAPATSGSQPSNAVGTLAADGVAPAAAHPPREPASPRVQTRAPYPGRVTAIAAGPEPRFRLSAGSAVAQTFKIWGPNFFVLFAVGALVMSPGLAVSGLIAFLARDEPLYEGLGSVANLLTLILSVVRDGAVTYVVIGRLAGSRPSIAAGASAGWSRGGAVFSAQFLAGLAILAAVLCLILPALIVATWLWIVVPIAMFESPGATAALTRSRQLTAGNRWPVFACMAYLGIIRLAGFLVIVACVRGVGGPTVFLTAAGSSDASFELATGAKAVVDFLNLPFATLGAVGPAVVYQHIRAGRERVSAETLMEAVGSLARG